MKLPKINSWILLIGIVLFGLILRLFFFSGMGVSDSLEYSKAAVTIDKGIDPNSVLTLSTRIGLVYATALSYSLFGINDASSVLFVLLTSLGMIILAYFFGKLLFNENIGLFAAFLMSFYPLEVHYATQLVSDMPAAFFMSLGVFAFLYAELKKPLKSLYVLSGLLIGIGYLIRESVLIIALFFAGYIVYKRKLTLNYFLVPLGVVLIFIIEAFIFFQLSGDPLYRTHASQAYLDEAMLQYDFFGRKDFPMGLLHYPWLFLTEHLLTFFYLFTAIAVLFSIRFRKKESNILLLWLLILLIYLSVGSASISMYAPFRAVDRYTSVITMPAILLLSNFLMQKQDSIRKTLLPAMVAILLMTSLGTLYLKDASGKLHSLKQAYPYLQSLDKTAYMDSRSLMAMEYISGYSKNENFKEYPSDFKGIRSSYIVINSDMLEKLKASEPNRAFPKEIEQIPKNWQLAKEVGSKKKIVIYYIP